MSFIKFIWTAAYYNTVWVYFFRIYYDHSGSICGFQSLSSMRMFQLQNIINQYKNH